MMKNCVHQVVVVVLAVLVAMSALSAAQDKVPIVAGDWIYSSGAGKARIEQSQQHVTMLLTWTPSSDRPPHYQIDARLSGNALDGTWRCIAAKCMGQGGTLHGELSAKISRIVFTKVEEPAWNGLAGLILTPAPNADEMKNALNRSGALDIYGILFDTDRATLKAESKPTLDQVAKLLKQNPALKLEIAGHTDNTGTAQHNLALSEARAHAVVQALVKNYDISAARLHAAGYGDRKPVAPNDDEQGRAKNRRVELRKF
jgi:outer membrane protein OmpA-like peptidoglycan-associated protein